MEITKTEIKNHIDGRAPVATYYGGAAGLGLEIYNINEKEETVYFVEVVGTKETSKKAKVSINNDGRCGFRCGHQVVWLDECVRTGR